MKNITRYLCLFGTISIIGGISGCSIQTFKEEIIALVEGSADTTDTTDNTDTRDSWDVFVAEQGGYAETIAAVPPVDVNEAEEALVIRKPDIITDSEYQYNSNIPNELAELSCEDTLKILMDSFKDLEWEYIENLCVNFAGLPFDTSDDFIMQELFSKMVYKIESVSIEGSEAKCKIKVRMPQYKDELYQYYLNTIIDVEDDQIQEQLKKDIKKIIRSSPVEAKEIEITMKQTDSIWKIEMTEEFLNTVSGGLLDFYAAMLDTMKDEVAYE